jgi:peptide/nickel transport system ATP-binding protein/oligopeptide transport system ATP-binding protein
LSEAPLLAVEGLIKRYPVDRDLLGRSERYVHAVDGVSFTIAAGETLGLVGESGCGKSTVARCIVRLIEPTAGRVMLRGVDIAHLSPVAVRPLRRELQMIFQDPVASLNPRMTVGDIVGEPLRNFGVARGIALTDRIAELFRRVGLRPDQMGKYPHEFSGGQRQRIGIARAIALNPALVVCDEPVSALDVSVQAQVINLLEDLQRELGLAYLFVAHDLAVVEQVSDRVAVMYLGKIVELAARDRIFDAPQHPYTEALLAAVPVADPSRARRRPLIGGEVPSPIDPPPGCRFQTRCPLVEARCRREEPALREVSPGHFAACHLRLSQSGMAEPNS